MPDGVHPFSSHPTISQHYANLVSELSHQVATQHPEDILQFCFDFFLQRLLQERSQIRNHHSFQGIIYTIDRL
jgi:type III secretory pathway component EscV